MEMEAALKLSAEEAQKEQERHAAEILEAQKSERKARRKIIAMKAKTVENFIQHTARDPARQARPAMHNELLELYTKATRLSLTLYNEFEHPSSTAVGGEDWEELKVTY